MKKAFSLLFAAYAVPLFVCIFLAPRILYDPVTNALLLSLIATSIVFVFSVATNNSSMYDPYWSVAPVFLFLYWMHEATSLRILFLLLLLLWSVRLTINCCIHWKGLSDEDWRYRSFREKTGKWYWPVSFLGIHIFPTILVFCPMLPAFAILTRPAKRIAPVCIGFSLMIAAFVLELIADRQMDRFQKTRHEQRECCTAGLWGYSRHPNYLGENCLWWGIFIASLGFDAPPLLIFSPIAMTGLFLCYSIPAMEARQTQKRPSYREVKKRVPMFLITGRHWK